MVLTGRCRAELFHPPGLLTKGRNPTPCTTSRTVIPCPVRQRITIARRELYYTDFPILHESAEGHRLPTVGA